MGNENALTHKRQ